MHWNSSSFISKSVNKIRCIGKYMVEKNLPWKLFSRTYLWKNHFVKARTLQERRFFTFTLLILAELMFWMLYFHQKNNNKLAFFEKNCWNLWNLFWSTLEYFPANHHHLEICVTRTLSKWEEIKQTTLFFSLRKNDPY